MRVRASFSLVLPLFLMLLLLPGCGDDAVQPVGQNDEATIRFDGSWTEGSFVLQRIEQPGPDGVIRIELVGSNLRVDEDTEQIYLDVAVRNESGRTLYPPLRVFVGAFLPDDVLIVNGDESILGAPPDPSWPYPHLFDYSGQLGEDGYLAAGETSEPRTWQFRVPGLVPFSFGSEVRVGLEPMSPVIGGTVFTDLDRDGVFDEGEPTFGAGFVSVEGPTGPVFFGRVQDDGSFRFPAGAPGLYRVGYAPPPLGSATSPLPFCLTTPNPLQVVLPPGPDGQAQSFLDANIGVDPDPCLPPNDTVIHLIEGPADSVETDFFRLISAEVRGSEPVDASLPPLEVLEVEIGYSGCGPDHPVRAFAGADLQGVDPSGAAARTWLRIQHDNLGELCDAYFERSFTFNLAPLRLRYRELFGGEGPIVLELKTPDGQLMELTMP